MGYLLSTSPQTVWNRARTALRPPPKLTGTEWARTRFYLSAEYSAEPGRYDPNRAAFQPGILDACTDPANEEIVLMTSAQVGKTLSESIVLGYFIDQDPSPTLMVLPTLEMAEMFSKERLAPMCRDIPQSERGSTTTRRRSCPRRSRAAT